MTATNNSYGTTSQDIEGLIVSLQAEVELDPTDLVSKISLATVLEQSGKIEEAKLVYQEVIDADPTGSMGAIALKAWEGLDIPKSGFLELPTIIEDREELPPQKLPQQTQELPLIVKPKRKKALQWFYDLPISRKQLIALLASEVLSVIALGVGARHLIETGLRGQLLNQASSEVAVTEINYNIKINQMGFGFRGQSDNPAIANAVKAAAGGTIPQALQSQVEKILKNEVTARKIEYATLVGKDLRIIVVNLGNCYFRRSLVEQLTA